MNETLKRAISGIIYVVLLIFSITYSVESFFVLFGLFLVIAVYEFCQLVQLNKILPILFAVITYGSVTYLESQKIPLSKSFDYTLLITTLAISIRCIYFLFDDKQYKVEQLWKYLFLLGYIILPFIIITKIPFGINGYNHKIIIGSKGIFNFGSNRDKYGNIIKYDDWLYGEKTTNEELLASGNLTENHLYGGSGDDFLLVGYNVHNYLYGGRR